MKFQNIMRKIAFIFFTLIILSSCAPSVYKLYDKYEQDPNFEQTKISGELLQIASFFIPEEQKAAHSLLQSVNSVAIVHYKGKGDLGFQADVLNSLKRGGYRKVLKSKSASTGASYFVKSRLGRVKEFHVLNYEDGNISLFSVDGKFSIGNLEKVYKLIKKQSRVKNFIDNFDLRNIRSQE